MLDAVALLVRPCGCSEVMQRGIHVAFCFHEYCKVEMRVAGLGMCLGSPQPVGVTKGVARGASACTLSRARRRGAPAMQPEQMQRYLSTSKYESHRSM